jgi:hypothetical protein
MRGGQGLYFIFAAFKSKNKIVKKVVSTCGLIAGAIGSAFMGIGVDFFVKNHHVGSQVVGYTSLLLSGSLIFVGIKIFRDKYNSGVVSFGRAFLTGLYISLIASTIYVAVWALEYKFIFPDFLDKYSAFKVGEVKASGASPERMATKLKELATYRDMYKNPVFFTLITYAQYLPGGVIISLIAALILKKKSKETIVPAS